MKSRIDRSKGALLVKDWEQCAENAANVSQRATASSMLLRLALAAPDLATLVDSIDIPASRYSSWATLRQHQLMNYVYFIKDCLHRLDTAVMRAHKEELQQSLNCMAELIEVAAPTPSWRWDE